MSKNKKHGMMIRAAVLEMKNPRLIQGMGKFDDGV